MLGFWEHMECTPSLSKEVLNIIKLENLTDARPAHPCVVSGDLLPVSAVARPLEAGWAALPPDRTGSVSMPPPKRLLLRPPSYKPQQLTGNVVIVR